MIMMVGGIHWQIRIAEHFLTGLSASCLNLYGTLSLRSFNFVDDTIEMETVKGIKDEIKGNNILYFF